VPQVAGICSRIQRPHLPKGNDTAKSIWLTIVAGLAMATTVAAPAAAEESTCRGSIGAVTVDNLRVPQ